MEIEKGSRDQAGRPAAPALGRQRQGFTSGTNVHEIGRLGEVRVQKVFSRAGWQCSLQPGSGSVGTREGSLSWSGDLRARTGEVSIRVEVKHLQHEPRALQALRGGCDVLAYLCSTTNKMAFFLDEGLFRDLIAWAAEAQEAIGEKGDVGNWPHHSARLMRRTVAKQKIGSVSELIDGEIARERLLDIVPELDPVSVLGIYNGLAEHIRHRARPGSFGRR